MAVFVLLLLASVNHAEAQGVSAYFGVGSATDGPGTSSTCPAKQILDFTTFSAGVCEPAPNIGGAFGLLGADFMITPHLGVNAEYSFRFAQASFLPVAGLNVRPGFYDFNAVYQPSTGTNRVVPVLEAGIGGAKLSFYSNSQSCVSLGTCLNTSQALFTSSHFQLHGAVGVKIYVKSDMFIKPQIDLHWAPHLNQQYSSDFVPQYTLSVGYTFGRH